jgi:hypothetical protein
MTARIAATVALFTIGSCFAKSYHAERYDVSIRPDRQGNASVIETVLFRFETGSFTYVFRDLSTRETDGITDVRAFLDGQACSTGNGPGQVEISRSSPVRVRWHFPPISDASHEFRVEYRASGIARKRDDADVIAWRALPGERAYRIDEATVGLEYPAGVVPLVAPWLRRVDASVQAGPDSASVWLRDIPPKRDVVLEARFPRGSLGGAPPHWQAAAEARQREIATGIRNGVIVTILALALLVLVVVRVRSGLLDPRSEFDGLTVHEPPADLKPALAAVLAGRSAGAIGTLLELARRGVLKIEEVPKHWGSRDFLVTRRDEQLPLSAHESELMKILFASGTQVKMSKAATRMQMAGSKIGSAVRRELTAAGMLSPEKKAQRSKAVWAMVGLALAGVVVAAVLLVRAGSPAFAAFFGIGFSAGALISAIVIASTPVWTEQGAIVTAQWRAFARYIRDVSRGREPLPGPDRFEALLPYAAAFGVAAPWTKRFQKEGEVPFPGWFASLASDAGSGVDSFVAFTSTADSSGGAGGGGGGGASGGGSSGAG